MVDALHAREAGISRPAVWRWQRRYVEAGIDGLLRDKTRKPGKAPLGDAVAHRVLALTCGEPPGEATHWTGRMVAEAAGISLRSVQRIWAAHKLQPHRLRTFKRSRDPAFTKLEAIVGLYLAPPRHAVVLSVDESWAAERTNQIQPAQRAPAPSLQAPMPEGIGGALDRTHHPQQADDPPSSRRLPVAASAAAPSARSSISTPPSTATSTSTTRTPSPSPGPPPTPASLPSWTK